MMLNRAPDEAPQWQPLDLTPYRVDIDNPSGDTFFKWNERDYIHIDGHVYGVRELVAGRWWIVSRTDPRLPHIPLISEGYVWEVKPPQLGEAADAAGATADIDGFVRKEGHKLIRYGGKLLHVGRSFIGGEASLSKYAIIPGSPLGAPNDVGIFSLSGGREMIEGQHGYYRLISDDSALRFYVGDILGTKQVEAEYSLDTSQWSVINAAPAEVMVERHDAAAGSAGGKLLPPLSGETSGEQRSVPRSEDQLLQSGSETQEASHQTQEHAPPVHAANLAPIAQAESFSDVMVIHPQDKRYLSRTDSVTFSQSAELAESHFFFQNRKKLGRRVKKTLKMMSDFALLQTDPVDASGRPVEWVVGIRDMRKEIAKVLGLVPHWDKKSIVQKQYASAEAVRTSYGIKTDHGLGVVAHCNEMADLMFAELFARRKFKDHVLEIYFKESTGMTHVLVLYAEHPALLEKFGPIRSSDQSVQTAPPKFNKDQFADWVFGNRQEVLMIDPWGKKKVLDFSDLVRIEDVRSQLDDLVKSADFTDVQQRYTVQVLVPSKRVGAPRKSSSGSSTG